MKIKFGVASFLFVCSLGANGAANAQTVRDDRYLDLMQSSAAAPSVQLQTRHKVRHSKHMRRMQVRNAAAHFAGPRHTRRTVVASLAQPRQEEPAAPAEQASSLRALVAQKAAEHGVPAHVAQAVVQVESRYQANVTGRAGEVGLMQIKYTTARGLGYTGTRAALYDPATNIEWGMRYLAGAHKLAGGNLCGTLAKYQGGHGTRGTRTSHNYCGRVQTVMAGSGIQD